MAWSDNLVVVVVAFGFIFFPLRFLNGRSGSRSAWFSFQFLCTKATFVSGPVKIIACIFGIDKLLCARVCMSMCVCGCLYVQKRDPFWHYFRPYQMFLSSFPSTEWKKSFYPRIMSIQYCAKSYIVHNKL